MLTSIEVIASINSVRKFENKMTTIRRRLQTHYSLDIARFIWFLGIGILCLCLLGFGDLAEDVWFREGFSWDTPVALALHHLSQPWLTSSMILITATGNGGAIALVSGLAIWFYWRRQTNYVILLTATFGGAMACNTLLKQVFMRMRPHLFPPLVVEADYSFPSGHTVAAMTSYGLLAVMLWRQGYYGWALCAGSWVMAVAVSRVYLGVHYPSDVLAALMFGVLWLTAAFTVFGEYRRRSLLRLGEITH